MSGLFDTTEGDAVYISRRDPEELLGTHSRHQILLDEKVWSTAEHYYQAMRFTSEADRDQVRAAIDARHARLIGEPGFLGRLSRRVLGRQRTDWDRVCIAFMTRALWTKCQAWPLIADTLIATGEARLVENDQYDYFWGCGRDLRGNNHYGQILMNIRARLRDG